MTSSTWTLSASDGGALEIRTGVTGRASKMGHRLRLRMATWEVTVEQTDGQPTSVSLRVPVDSLEVVSGEGGVTPLIGPEKMLARSNALGTFHADKFPEIHFDTTDVEATEEGYRLTGTLQIHGVSRTRTVDIAVDGRTVSMNAVVRQTDFDIKPYSQLLGAMKVVDDVTVTFEAELPR